MDVVVSKYFETADDLEDALRKAKEAPQYVAAAQQSANTASNAAREAVNTAAQIVTEEDARQRAEATRRSAEAERAAGENERNTGETSRTSAESARVLAEEGRGNAESWRVHAEDLREDAETERRATFDSVLDQAAAAKEAAKASETAAAESAEAAKASETTVTESAAAAETARTGAKAAQVAAEAAKTGAQASQEAAAGSAATAKTEADRAKTEADRAAEIATGDFIPTAQKGAANGVATLDSDGKVPADQLPPMNYDPAGAAQVVQGNLQTHIADKGNPHGVTAAQVGARPSTWVPSKDEIGLGSVDNTADSQKNVNYANSAGNASRLIGAGWNWSGQGGQPSWLWGGNDGQNMYVYNPANFSVNYANTAGNTNAVGGRAAGTVLNDIDSLKAAGGGVETFSKTVTMDLASYGRLAENATREITVYDLLNEPKIVTALILVNASGTINHEYKSGYRGGYYAYLNIDDSDYFLENNNIRDNGYSNYNVIDSARQIHVAYNGGNPWVIKESESYTKNAVYAQRANIAFAFKTGSVNAVWANGGATVRITICGFRLKG